MPHAQTKLMNMSQWKTNKINMVAQFIYIIIVIVVLMNECNILCIQYTNVYEMSCQ